MKINGGATLWARQTIDSDIFYDKPDVWFKIWFYLVNQVNHKDDKRFKRGSCFLKYEWIMDKAGATKNQVKHCIEYLKKDKMLATQKATRGFIVKVLNYNTFQTLDNYKKPQEKEHKRNTINKNDKNIREEFNNKIQNTNSKETKKKPANNIEFDFELWSWHGIDQDIKDRWTKIFPHIEVEIELVKMREFFKKRPRHKKVIKDRFNNNYAIYIFDWLTRAEGYAKEEGGEKNDN